VKALILFLCLLPLGASALDVGIGVGLSNGGQDNAMMQREYAQLRQDIRSLEILERNLRELGQEPPPAGLKSEASGEWQQQSEWLVQQSDEVDRLVQELRDYLQEFTRGSAATELFDYQAAKFKSSQRLNSIKNAAKEYPLKGKEAIERQSRAVKLMARSD
jgi:hypothetical protein